MPPSLEFSETTAPARSSEGESASELNDATSDRCSGDRTHAWVGNPRCKRARIEVVAGISEAWMVQDVNSVHPQLKLALFPARDAKGFAQ